jgi:hypothetical protein
MSPSFTSTPALQNTLDELEIQRKKILSSKIQGWCLIGVGLIGLFVVLSFDPIFGIITGAVFLIPGAFILYKISDAEAEYKYRFKQEIIAKVLQSISHKLTYDPKSGIYESEFIATQLFSQEPDSYKTEDLVSGQIEKTAFFFAEVHAQYKTETPTKNGTRTEWHDIFKGILFAADFNKNFKGVTIVRPKDIGSSIGAWFSKNIYAFGDKNVIELENEYFSKNFVTYSNDQIEARYILTPALMEKIGALNERSAYCVSLSFINSNMYIAFPLDKNYFEAPIFKSLLKPDVLENDIQVLHFMYDIVSELDLNTRIWTKT